MRNRHKYLLPLLSLVILFSACATIAPTQVEPTEKDLRTDIEIVSTLTMPVPVEGKGVVCGYLLDEETSEPPQAALFLSPNIAADREDVPAMMSFSFQTNPRADTAEDGYFCFEDVTPGVYALTLWAPPDDVEFVQDEEGQDYLWIEIEPGSVMDLGHLSQ